MDLETGTKDDAAFIRENVDIKYLKKAIDMSLVDSLLGQFTPTPAPTATSAPKKVEGPEPEAPVVLEPKQEKSILSRIKDFWRGTDKEIEATDAKVKNLNSLLKKAKEVQALKKQYEMNLSEKLGKEETD
jgi:hypothetical protein